MALDPKLLQFFIEGLRTASFNTFKNISAQIFDYLKNVVKDNPVYDIYEQACLEWIIWPDNDDWELPNDFQKSKKLSYALFKRLALTDNQFGFLYNITNEGEFERSKEVFNATFLGYFGKALEDIIQANPEIENFPVEKTNGNKVFIIHGHDELLKKDVQLLLTRAGVNNVVLHECPDKGRTIIDKLVEEGNDSNFAIALLTPDDIFNDDKVRARQNVILEIGYFMGQLGKNRVRLLVKEDVEIPSDLSGILYEKYDSNGAWRLKLLKELIAVGIFVDHVEVMKTL